MERITNALMNVKYCPILLLLSLLLLTGGMSAQNLSAFQFGIQASPTFSGMSTNDNFINREGTNLGLKLGLIGEYYFQENYSVHTGLTLQFNSGGALFYENRFENVDIWRESLEDEFPPSAIPDSITGGLNYKYNLSYFEIPLGLTLRTREFGYLRYFVRPLVALGISTGANGTIENAGFISNEEDFDISAEVNSIALNWGLGGGVEYAVSTSTSIIAGLSYQSTFTDVTDDGGSLRRPGRNASEDDSKASINQIVLTLGVMF